MELSDIYVDPKKVEGGAWVTWDLHPDISCLIARIDNRRYFAKMAELAVPHREAIRNGTLSNEIDEEIGLQCLAHCVLLDWKGVTKDGEPLPYTPELGVEILGKPEAQDLVAFVNRSSRNQDLFKLKAPIEAPTLASVEEAQTEGN